MQFLQRQQSTYVRCARSQMYYIVNYSIGWSVWQPKLHVVLKVSKTVVSELAGPVADLSLTGNEAQRCTNVTTKAWHIHDSLGCEQVHIRSNCVPRRSTRRTRHTCSRGSGVVVVHSYSPKVPCNVYEPSMRILLLHASKTPCSPILPDGFDLADHVPKKESLVCGCIIGAVLVESAGPWNRERHGSDPWAVGPFCYDLKRTIRLNNPIYCSVRCSDRLIAQLKRSRLKPLSGRASWECFESQKMSLTRCYQMDSLYLHHLLGPRSTLFSRFLQKLRIVPQPHS
jgi:hypothetical protein